MFDLEGLEPGPFSPADLPLAGRLFAGPVFEPLAEPLATAITRVDGPLAMHGATVADNVPQDLDAAYARSVGVAEDAHADQVAAGEQSQAGVLVDAGAGVDAYRAAVLPHLPGPDTSVRGDLKEPPVPPPALVDGGDRPEPPEQREPL